jgi:hypothetical protein
MTHYIGGFDEKSAVSDIRDRIYKPVGPTSRPKT